MQVLGEHESNVKRTLEELGVYLKPSSYAKDIKPLLKEACSAVFGNASGLVDMLVKHIPSSKAAAKAKARLRKSLEDLCQERFLSMMRCAGRSHLHGPAG